MNRVRQRVVLIVVAFVFLGSVVRASELSEDLTARRARAMERLGPEAMQILWSAPTRPYSLDIDYEYRQDSNLYYLTGVAQEDTILVLMPGNTSRREVLFIKDKDPAREHWRGRMLSAQESSERTGIETVLTTSQFEPFVAAMLSGRGACLQIRSAETFSRPRAGVRPGLREHAAPDRTTRRGHPH